MESAVTWGEVLAFAGLGALGIVVILILLAVAGFFNDWSH